MNTQKLLIFLSLSLTSTISSARWMDLTNPPQVEAEEQVITNVENTPVKTCWGWGCAASMEVFLGPEEWERIDSLFTPLATSAREERKQIRLAIGTMEEIVGELNGQTKYDLGAPNSNGIGKPGQTDCVDESTNTTRYLKFLQARGHLRFHKVTEIEIRLNKPFLPFLGQHYTATIQSLSTGERFAVDGWWYDNGTPAVIQELESWLSRDGFDPDRVP